MPKQQISGIKTQLVQKVEVDFGHFFFISPDLMCVINVNTYFQYLNPTWSRTTGFKLVNLLTEPMTNFLHPEDKDDVLNKLQVGFSRKKPIAFESRFLCKDGTYKDFAWVGRQSPNQDQLFVMARDISEKKHSEILLRRSESRYRHLLEAIPDMMFVVERGGRLKEFYPDKASKQAGLSTYESLTDLGLMEHDHQQLLHLVEKALETNYPQSLNYTLEGKHAMQRFDSRITPLNKDEVLVFARNITEYKTMEAALDRLTLHDAVTGLPNRHFLEKRLTQFYSSSHTDSDEYAIVYLNLSRFKFVNDTLGYAAADLVLVETAERLRDVVRDRDMVARVGGDEFAIFLPYADEKAVVQVAERVHRSLQLPFVVQGRRFNLGASVGIASMGEQSSFSELMRRANMAMYRNKEKDGGIHFYNPEADKRLKEKQWLEQELREALKADRLSLHYQPIVDLVSGKLVLAEALLRWKHAEKGMISPGSFIPVAEEVGLIVELDYWVIKRAIHQAKEGGFSVAVNLSPISLGSADLVGYISSCLKQAGLEASCLCLEITEQVFANPKETLSTVEDLHNLGVHIAVDDFGTGYSSLVYLSSYPLDILKVDQGFIRSFKENAKSKTIARNIIRMAHSLDLIALAEGIETQEQLTWLQEEGCEQGQGFFFERPLSYEALLNLKSKSYL